MRPDEVDATLVVLSLSSEVRMPFKEAELKPVISAQNKPVVFYSYTLPSDFARRELAKSGVVVLSGLTHVGVAMRRLLDYSKFRLAPEADAALLPARDLSAHLASGGALGSRQQGAVARRRHRAAGRSAGRRARRARSGDRKRGLSAGHEDPVARYRTQERDRRRPRQHRDQGRGVLGLARSDGECAALAPRGEDPGRAGRPDGEEGRRDHHRLSGGRDVRPAGDGGAWRRRHRIVPRRDLPPGAGRRRGGGGDAGPVEGRGAAQGISRCAQGRYRRLRAIDRADVAARSSFAQCRCRHRAQPGAGASARTGRHDRGCAGGAEELDESSLRSGSAILSSFRGARQREPRNCASGISRQQLRDSGSSHRDVPE